MHEKEKKDQARNPPQCCPYCADSKFPCVKMERAIKRAVAEEFKKEKENQSTD